MTYRSTNEPVPKEWRIHKHLDKTRFIAQVLALAFRPRCHGAYIVLFVDNDAYSYQYGLVEDYQFEAVAKLAREHKHLTEED